MPLLKIKTELFEDEYIKLNNLPESKRALAWAKDNNRTDIFYGRGIYDFWLSEENGKYYAKMKIGDSCD